MDRRSFNKFLATSFGATALPLSWIATPVSAAGETVINTIVNPEPAMLMLGLNQQAPTGLVASKIYQGLVTYDFDLNPHPCLASDWTVSDDGLEYTFNIRDDVLWHDGTPMTVDDVLFTANEFLQETNPRSRLILSKCDSIEEGEGNTVIFRLKAPFGPFLLAFDASTFPVLPAHLYKGTDFKTNPNNDTPIGTGPFKFKEWVRGSHIHLVRNEHYYVTGKPQVSDIYYRIIPDAAARAVALENQSAQLGQSSDVEPMDFNRLADLPHLNRVNRGYEFAAPILWLEINNRIEGLNDKRMRQAIMHALDREFIVENIFFGIGSPATGAVNSRTKFFSENKKVYDFNPEKAGALLDEMGLTTEADGMRIRFDLIVPPFGEVYSRLSEYTRQALRRVGIDVNLVTTDVAGFAGALSNWEYQLTFNYTFQYGDPALGIARTYITENIVKGVLFSNTEGYSNPDVDALFAEAESSTNDAERAASYEKVQQLLAEDVPLAWLVELEFPALQGVTIEDVITTASGLNGDFEDARVVA